MPKELTYEVALRKLGDRDYKDYEELKIVCNKLEEAIEKAKRYDELAK